MGFESKRAAIAYFKDTSSASTSKFVRYAP